MDNGRSDVCPECGAPGAACEARFHQFLALEYESPAYWDVHHLTVTTFMLQHSSKLTRDGWLQEQQLLKRFLMDGATPAQVRRESGNRVDGRNRQSKFKSRDGLPLHNRTRWSMTIMDVREQHAAIYCADVRKWARASLDDSQSIQVEQHQDG